MLTMGGYLGPVSRFNQFEKRPIFKKRFCYMPENVTFWKAPTYAAAVLCARSNIQIPRKCGL